MKLKLYFDQDKIIAQGNIIIPLGDDLPKEVYSGIDIVREYDNNHYEISLNMCLEQKILKIYNEGRPGIKSRVYDLVGTREAVAYDLLIGRLVVENDMVKETNNYYFLWKDIIARGVYLQTCAAKKHILDKAVYDGIFEYDNNGYYSVSHSFVNHVKQKKSYVVKDAMDLIKCPDDTVTISVFENIGYTWKNGRLVQGKDNNNLFDQ